MSEASSSLDPRTPVIIGVGQILNRVDQGANLYEPAALMTQALLAAQADSGAEAALASAQVVAAVPTISWRYSNPGALVREQLGCVDAKTWYATVGGNTLGIEYFVAISIVVQMLPTTNRIHWPRSARL